MAKPRRRAAPKRAATQPRSAKAGKPPQEPTASRRVRRRQKTARVALTKGTTVFGTDHGPRAAWPASVAKRKKR